MMRNFNEKFDIAEKLNWWKNVCAIINKKSNKTRSVLSAKALSQSVKAIKVVVTERYIIKKENHVKVYKKKNKLLLVD